MSENRTIFRQNLVSRSHLLWLLARRERDGHLLFGPGVHGRFGFPVEEAEEAERPRLLLGPLHGGGLEWEQQPRTAGQPP